MSRIFIGKAKELPPGLSRSVWVEGRRVAIFNRAGEYFAMDAACPHMGADLSNGTLSGDTLTCAWHHWKFHLPSGEGLTKDWARLKVHRLFREGEDLVLEIAAPEELSRAAADPASQDSTS